ncbi:CHAT domain-containing protein [Streptomyces scopuliridis]|uniref:CHAT domain-containing protein n=1 Tax=Streptomyces scopuliridis TaxID=452529 RepID=A0ACD4ZD30_9ACTN|nr:CHAT domain-containing protein [Streptomyces scopuliridis]WSB96064.1 CHAT domain-containing protein [Streptomyces scopuliridis]WSC10230.1 CHAT domain-containing protein [Streptomyces scopuliridis]
MRSPSDSPDRLLALSDLGIQLLERYRQSYDPEDLREAVGIARDVLAQLPPGSPHLAHCLSALGSALMMLRQQEGSTRGPVLDHLGIQTTTAGPLPRVWWSPGGVLGTLPLHAATPQEGARGALDRVVSSYTPTLRALHHARQRAARPAGTGALIVAVGDAAGLASLPAAHREAEHLARLLPGPEVLTGASATHSAVVSALPRHAYAHFACHALGDLERPSGSRLVLHDHAERPLTVRDLARLRLPSVRLAYFSACDTLRTSPELADEAVHIVSALQIAGFPHVVGSLWHVDDTIGAGVARGVYEALSTGDGALDVDRTAEALHSAVCALRDTYPRTPSLWACQVHAGP